MSKEGGAKIRKKTFAAIVLTQLLITMSSSACFAAASPITCQLGEHAVELVGTSLAAQSTTISISVSQTSIIEGYDVTVSGEIEPPDQVSITLLYTMPDGSTFTRNVTSSSDGSFSDLFEPNVAGSWSVKASWAGSETQAGATSSTESFTVLEADIWDDAEDGDGLDFWKVWEPLPSWMLIIVAVVAFAIFIGIIIVAIKKK
ncbi:MAG TPA: hypothetical protein ENN36_02400 [Candidatus Bathyarchaeota archaeon]|nr:hypothetical protein [Candidatus Bathyarchaeota archaeon]